VEVDVGPKETTLVLALGLALAALRQAQAQCAGSLLGVALNRAATGSGNYEPTAVAANLDELAVELERAAAAGTARDRQILERYVAGFRELAILMGRIGEAESSRPRGDTSRLEVRLRDRMRALEAAVPERPSGCREIVAIDG